MGIGTAAAADFYAAPAGSAGGTGTVDSPWDLQTALDQTGVIKPGDTLWLRGGRYVEPTGPRWYFRTYLAGAPGQPITIRAYAGERATIDGGFEINGAWTVWRDLEVFSSDPTRVTSQPGSFPTDITRPIGFNVFGPNTKIINNVVHDTFNGLGLWQEAPDTEAYGNLIYYSGWVAPDRGHGHSIYVQNTTGAKRLADNVLLHSFDIGLQGSGGPGNNNLTVEGNIMFQGGVVAGAPTMNLLVSSAVLVQNPIIRNNYTYFSAPYGRLDLGGLFGPGCTNLRADNNYFADVYELGFFDCNATSITGNVFYGDITWRDGGVYKPEDQFRARYPGNTYQGATRPAGVRVFVRPNQYQAKRANIVIFNWDMRGTVDVDVSAAGLVAGDTYELRNAQNYYGDVVTGIYGGRPITISMTGRSMAQPVGYSTPPSTFPEFGAFILSVPVSASTPPVSVSMTPSGATLSSSQSQQFTASVTGTSNTAVVWSMTPTVGTLSSGFYTAPASIAAAQTVAIRVTSVADPTASATATVNLTAPPPPSATLSGLSLSTSTVSGGVRLWGNRVYLSAPAPAGGAVVSLLSSQPAVATVPVTVTVPGGAKSRTFAIRTSVVTAPVTASISASYGGKTLSMPLQVKP